MRFMAEPAMDAAMGKEPDQGEGRTQRWRCSESGNAQRKNNTTTIATKRQKVNLVEHLCRRVVTGKWTQAGMVKILLKEMTMIVLNVMW